MAPPFVMRGLSGRRESGRERARGIFVSDFIKWAAHDEIETAAITKNPAASSSVNLLSLVFFFYSIL
jgi:hypothetical protein